MEALATGFSILLFCSVVFLALGFGLRHRTSINKWLNPTYYACDDRKLRLQRKIEDAQNELKWIEKQEQAETED